MGDQHVAPAYLVMKETCVRQVQLLLCFPCKTQAQYYSLIIMLSALRPGDVRTRLGEVSELLLPSLQQEAELGGSGAALPHVWRTPAVCHDP